ncbi:MAG TPA: hypothetical protein VK986_19455 [Tepidisphaeraceae bacterium]|nr:hypothetical protein [Tepidisphaeraceae bacterium]
MKDEISPERRNADLGLRIANIHPLSFCLHCGAVAGRVAGFERAAGDGSGRPRDVGRIGGAALAQLDRGQPPVRGHTVPR